MNERMDSGLEGYMKGWIPNWWDLELEGHRTRGIQKRMDERKGGFRTGRI